MMLNVKVIFVLHISKHVWMLYGYDGHNNGCLYFWNLMDKERNEELKIYASLFYVFSSLKFKSL